FARERHGGGVLGDLVLQIVERSSQLASRSDLEDLRTQHLLRRGCLAELDLTGLVDARAIALRLLALDLTEELDARDDAPARHRRELSLEVVRHLLRLARAELMVFVVDLERRDDHRSRIRDHRLRFGLGLGLRRRGPKSEVVEDLAGALLDPWIRIVRSAAQR